MIAALKPGGMKAAGSVIGAMFVLASCAYPAHVLNAPPLVPEPRRAHRVRLPAPQAYWEPVELEPSAAPAGVGLPLTESQIVRVLGANRVWDSLGPQFWERLTRDGLVVTSKTDASVHVGAFYMNVREQRVPYVVTLDALAYALHVALEHALAEIDDTLLAPGLEALVTKLSERLIAEQKGSGTELSDALGFTRAIVAVAQGLIEGKNSAPSDLSPEMAALVDDEISLVSAHEGPATSPLLGVPVDYGRFALPEAAAHPGAFCALAWLASSPLLFAAKGEIPGAVVGVARSRRLTRAAMIFARLTLPEVDPAISALWSRIARVLAFVWGPPDDLSAPDLVELASSVGLGLENPKHIANVVAVDRLRSAVVSRGRPPRVFDGAGAPARAGLAMRLFGGHAAADSIALTAMAGPLLGLTDAIPPPAIAHNGTRGLPSSLDLVAWLGAKEARASLRDGGEDSFAGYDAALARAISQRPTDGDPALHGSIHASLLDGIRVWLSPDADRALASKAVSRASIESALSAWTYLRHAGQPLSRPRIARSLHVPKDVEVNGAPITAFVEPAPEVIASLLATAGQMRRGLAGVGGLPPDSPAMESIAEMEGLLREALRIAQREMNDQALAPEDVSALASMPARISHLEAHAAAKVPVVAEVAVDAAGQRSLSSATGFVEPALTLVREPGSGRIFLAVGAHIAQYDLVEPRDRRSTDGSHQARLLRDAAPARRAYTVAFRLAK